MTDLHQAGCYLEACQGLLRMHDVAEMWVDVWLAGSLACCVGKCELAVKGWDDWGVSLVGHLHRL